MADVVLGRAIRFAGSNDDPPMKIVGIVTDARTEALSAQATPEVCIPLWQTRTFSKHLIVRTSGDPLAVAGDWADSVRTARVARGAPTHYHLAVFHPAFR